MMKRRVVLAAGAGGLGKLAAPAWVGAQSTWPPRGPIKLVTQFPPGGLVDTVARLMAPLTSQSVGQSLGQSVGQSVVVENRPSAGGVIGTDFVAKQPADGYTLLVGC
jgi:tripartite-type tricarboxylate transporter receptor subunit TctC